MHWVSGTQLIQPHGQDEQCKISQWAELMLPPLPYLQIFRPLEKSPDQIWARSWLVLHQGMLPIINLLCIISLTMFLFSSPTAFVTSVMGFFLLDCFQCNQSRFIYLQTGSSLLLIKYIQNNILLLYTYLNSIASPHDCCGTSYLNSLVN